MDKVYLIDYLGAHSGVPYFMAALKKFVNEIDGASAEIISNFADSEGQPPYLLNQYMGNILRKGSSLVRNLIRVRKLVKRNPECVFIFSTYGNWIDEKFIKLVSKGRRHVIDIHEAIAQNVDSDDKLKEKFKNLYSGHVKTVVSHSSRTDDFLREYGFKGKCFKVPHFKYILPKEFRVSEIAEDVLTAPDDSKINLLFFGNLNESKGVDILIEAVNMLEREIADRLNVIIAGKDFDGAVYKIKPKEDRAVTIIDRRLNDDELKYLYSKADYLALPYRKTSQSGILEMAFHFKTPIIASDLPYFRSTLTQFPSFGILTGNGAKEYADALKNAVRKHAGSTFFLDDEYANYENRKEIKQFQIDFAEWLRATR